MAEIANVQLEGVQLTPLKIIPGENGMVLHALKSQESSFVSFGEAYFSTVARGKKKGWKKHLRMTLNLVVSGGEIGFVMYDDRPTSKTNGRFFEVVLSRNNYQRLTVSPGIWMAFCGVGKEENMLLNLASIPHDPTEVETLPLENDRIKYSWPW
jgi:dTDP-4-dehydrorhamnose 3,5-epimerase